MAFTTAEEFLRLVQTVELRQLAEDHVLNGIPWVCRSHPEHYQALKLHIAVSLDIPPSEVMVVGSGRSGFSLSPDTFPRPFHAGSDIDVVVVSSRLFDVIWMTLARWGHPRRNSLWGYEQTWMKRQQEGVFWGWLQPEQLRLQGLRFGRELRPLRDLRSLWFETFQSIATAVPASGFVAHDVSGRLYRTREQLLMYHAESLRRLRYQLERRPEGEAAP